MRAAASAPSSRRGAAPDGYTLLGGTISSHAINVSLYPKLGYDPIKSFAPVTLIGTNPVVLVVNQASPYRTLKDVVDGSKAKAASGGLSSASAGTGTSQHLAMELLAYKSGREVHAHPLQGQRPGDPGRDRRPVDMMFDTTIVAGPHIQSGKLRAIAVTSSKRLPSMPDVPTVAESGIPGLKDFEWCRGRPSSCRPARPRLWSTVCTRRFARSSPSPRLQDKLKGFGMEPADMTTAQIAAFQKAEVDKWAAVIKAANIKPE